MALAVYGKHPAKGDFLDHGVPGALRPALEGWLDQVLAQARADLGSDWERVWAAAPPLRFWLGEAVWGQPVCGVMVPTQDRVGRRFPLVLMSVGDAVPPPVVDPDQVWYDAMAAHLARMLAMGDLPGPAALLTGAPVPHGTDAPGPSEFWAVRPGDATADLLADIAVTDHRRAAAGRSYWWVAGDAPPPEAEADVTPDDPEPALADPEPATPDMDAAPEPDLLPDAAPDLAAEADPSPWDMPDVDDSPFASGGGLSLFAAPLPPETSRPVAAPPTAFGDGPARGPLWSQVWAGEGLPSGPVIAWFLRGHDGNG